MSMNDVALLFPGQGSHFVGMGQDLYRDYNIVKEAFEEANDILGYDIKKICFEGNLFILNNLDNMFPALLTVCVSLFRVYMQEIGSVPQFSAGHSLGEYAALTCSGALDFADALRIIHKRGVLSQEFTDSNDGSITIIDGIDIKTAETVCRNISRNNQFVTVSCYNSPRQVAISGQQDAVMEAEDQLMELGGHISPLLTAPPIHSPLMQPVADQFEIELKNIHFHDLRWPVISNIDALPYLDSLSILPKLKLQLTNPVQWLNTIHYLEKQGVTTFIEIGPQSVLTTLLKTFINGQAMSYNTKENRQLIQELISR